MILEEIKTLKTSERDLRKFGLLVGAIFAALCSWLRHKPAAPYLFTIGILLVFFGWVAPRALKYVYIVWMSLAIVLGFLGSSVLLTLFFFAVITPIGLLARLCGKDFLSLRLDAKTPTYWIARARNTSKSPTQYEQQY